jgi:hypothetical protein
MSTLTFTAKDAKKIAEDQDPNSLQSILNDIRTKASRGEFETFIINMPNDVHSALVERGFEIGINDYNRSKVKYCVSWK